MNDSQMSFETFILSLGTATLVSLGEVKNPSTGKEEKNLVSAKQHIEILDLLEKKTVNNLTDQEKRLLQQILYELRLKYVAQTANTENKK
ncbi:MAG: hypothetical protein JWQ35_882 [Bacteriovoracaceae bacterium]|nr:hypothetical protein [Bacteriovoracaceae bacterium]